MGSYSRQPRIAKDPGEIAVGDIVWDGLDGFQVSKVNHSTEDGHAVAEMFSATGDRWRVSGIGGAKISVLADMDEAIERSLMGSDENPFYDDDDELEAW